MLPKITVHHSLSAYTRYCDEPENHLTKRGIKTFWCNAAGGHQRLYGNITMGGTKYNDELSEQTVVGHLTLLRRTIVNKKIVWECQCICGKVIRRRQDYLGEWLHSNRSHSCGCQHPYKINPAKDHGLWRGVGDMSGQYFAALAMSAKNRSIAFEITKEDAWSQFEKQDGKCAYTGLPLCFVTQRKRKRTPEGQTASLDRIDSSKGYTPDNICWVHKTVNHMKNKYSIERFLEICRLVTEHRNAALAC